MCLRAAHGAFPFMSIDEIEMDSLEHTLRIAQRYGYQDILVNTDSTMVVYYLRTKADDG